VDFTYEVPFAFTGTIDQLNYKLGPSQMTAEEQKKAAEFLARVTD
jgi:arylsulfatase